MARRWIGGIALAAYLIMGAMIYLTVLPGAGGHWPPDFHLTGYDAESIAPFLDALSADARAAYGRVLSIYDRVFIVAFALWMALMGWRGGGLRYFLAGLAALYAGIDLSENAALLRLIDGDIGIVRVAHHLTMAKFASLYLCILVLIVQVRRTQ